ncbi:uncharacterized protein LOC119744872 isoform X2 [Patiria miniata]|uniref:EF-hand domain-containing protein n=1 Tax=Patiria miniata TaxID=46514 RepID=A0A914BML4_PATMI|nr:uncharacterized protein LOC119744872 isoform X2 [Patiria miniata]
MIRSEAKQGDDGGLGVESTLSGKPTSQLQSPGASSDVAPSEILTAEQKEEFAGHDFCFDNIVFEGGGNKGLAAIGAIRVLEELGIWGNIKRFAGASAGSMIASLASVGYNSHDIETFLRGDIQKVFLDARFGKLSLLPNMLTKYGMYPGEKIADWFGERVKEKMGNPDLTFKQYGGDAREIMKDELEHRFEEHIKSTEKLDVPSNTKLAKKRRARELAQKTEEKHTALLTSFSKFLKVLNESDIDHSKPISQQEFEMAINKPNSEFTTEDKKQLFGDDFSDAKAFFKQLDTNGDGELTLRELMAFGESKGLEIMELFRGFSRQKITGLSSYFSTILDSLLLNMKRVFVQGSDVYRTIGINTGYLDTLDFKMEGKDHNYMVQQGKLGCIAFLRGRIAKPTWVRRT